jgi:magnesium-dependent phosphatase-1
MDQCVVVFIDLDGTLWDHYDVSILKTPFTKVSELEFIDSNGVVVRVYKLALEVLKYAIRRGFIVSTLSWNDPVKALQALRILGLEELFHYHAIENHPNKALMAQRVLRMIEERGLCRNNVVVIYIDDRELHLEDMKRAFRNLLYIKAWESCKNIGDCVELIERYIQLSKN